MRTLFSLNIRIFELNTGAIWSALLLLWYLVWYFEGHWPTRKQTLVNVKKIFSWWNATIWLTLGVYKITQFQTLIVHHNFISQGSLDFRLYKVIHCCNDNRINFYISLSKLPLVIEEKRMGREICSIDWWTGRCAGKRVTTAVGSLIGHLLQRVTN